MTVPKNPSINDIGKRYGRLVVTQISNRSGRVYADCKCDCGTEKEVRLDSVRSGKIKSCGCLQKECKVKNSTKHGMWGTKEYLCWQRMKSRCQPNNKEAFPHHAGKDIQVCDSWVESFENFYQDMGRCPEGYTLDRIDNSKDYIPENTRWVTKSMQLFNRELGKIAGVNFRKDRNKWIATICKDYKIIRLGSFDLYEDAVAARLQAEIDLFGEFSAKNFIADRDVSTNNVNNQ